MTRKALDLSLVASNDCHRCARSHQRHNVISGGFRRDARLAIVTDTPSFQDDQHGTLLIGLHGRILDDVLEQCGASREDVFTTPVLRCASPNKPQPSEVEACSGFLLDTLTTLTSNDLRAVIVLGQVAMWAMCDGILRDARWDEVRGRAFDRCFDEAGSGRVVRITPTWHPRDVVGNRERFSEMIAHFRYVCASLACERSG